MQIIKLLINMPYNAEDIDKLCSLNFSEIKRCSVHLLRKVATEMEIPNRSSYRTKGELCDVIKETISVRNSEKLLDKCYNSIKLIERGYKTGAYSDKEIDSTIEQLKDWYDKKLEKIKTLKSKQFTSEHRKTIFDLTSEYAEVNTQCKNLTLAISDKMYAKIGH